MSSDESQRAALLALLGRKLAGEHAVKTVLFQEAIADQTVRRIESDVVHHLEVERTVRRTGCMKAALVDSEADFGLARSDDPDLGIEQTIDRRRTVERFERTIMRVLSRRLRRRRAHRPP